MNCGWLKLWGTVLTPRASSAAVSWGLGDWILPLSLSIYSEPGWHYFPLPGPPPKLMVWFGGLLHGLVLSTLDIAGIP